MSWQQGRAFQSSWLLRYCAKLKYVKSQLVIFKNITSCDFTFAFWVKSSGSGGPIIAVRSISGKLFYVAIKSSMVYLSAYNTLEEAHFSKYDWNHIAVTCQHFEMKVFLNGTERAVEERWNEYFFLSDGFQHYYIIGNHPDLFKIPLITQPFVGSVMDLYMVGMALSVDQISDLFKGNICQLILFSDLT